MWTGGEHLFLSWLPQAPGNLRSIRALGFWLEACSSSNKRKGAPMSRNTSVLGIYSNRSGIEEAVDTLRLDGFRSTDISVLFPDNVGSKDFAHEKNTKAPEGAAAGMGAGAVVGGALGWLAGIGALAIAGLGPFVAAGPILGALAGA